MQRHRAAADEQSSTRLTPARAPELRVGVLIDTQMAEGWVVADARAALATVAARIAVVAIVHSRPRRSLAAAVHGVVDSADRLLRCRNEPLLARVDVIAALAATECLEFRVVTHDDGWTIGTPALKRLRRCAADFWLCCTNVPPRRPLSNLASRGVLGLEIGDGVPAASRWAGVAEIGRQSAVTSTRVIDYALAEHGCLHRSTGATIASSGALNRLAALRRGINGLVRAVADAAAGAANSVPSAAAAPLVARRSRPTLAGIVMASRRVLHGVVANRARALRWREQWQIAYQFGAEDAPLDLARLRYLVPPPDRYWADPFVLEHDNRHFVLFEEARYDEERGRIVGVEVHENAEPGAANVVLERPYHMSYPFLFRHDGALFMIPETAANRSVEVYRCETPPWHWRPHAVLLDNVRAFDVTLWQATGRWWMFASLAAPGTDGNDELHLYSSASPFGPWRPHRRNPVVADARRARSAGPLYRRDGGLYRPSQDCTPVYGHCVVINRVDVIDDQDYRETPVARVDPGWRADVRRVHTFGRGGRLHVLDCAVQRSRW